MVALTAAPLDANAGQCVTLKGVGLARDGKKACQMAGKDVEKQIKRLREKTGDYKWRVKEWGRQERRRASFTWSCLRSADVCTVKEGDAKQD